MNSILRPRKAGSSVRVSMVERNIVVARVVAAEAVPGSRLRPGLVLVGDGGVSSHELGEVRGVCAEVPLPRVSIVGRKLLLEGVCGMAAILGEWGINTQVYCPLGLGRLSALQRRLLKKSEIPCSGFDVGGAQATKYTQRVFAEGHQLAHVETEECVERASVRQTRRCLARLSHAISSSNLLCIADSGTCGLDNSVMNRLLAEAKRAHVRVLYEPRTPRLLDCRSVKLVKLNHNQMQLWYGKDASSDAEASTAVRRLLVATGAKAVFYTRGERGIMLCERVNGQERVSIVAAHAKKMFDAVAAGDIVTAALAFCLSKNYSLLEAACFAAAAAERGLEQRGAKHFDIKSLISLR